MITDTKPATNSLPFAYFGSSRLSVIVLNELKRLGLTPALIVTTPDKPQGRKLEIKPNVVKLWAIEHSVPVLDPLKLDASFIETLKKFPVESLNIDHWPVFIVASYGKIIPTEIIELPVHKTLNIHPSLLPLYRGASPLPTTILEDAKETGVSIMQLDAEMDHGPIVAQKKIVLSDHFSDWPIYEDFEECMAKQGAQLLAEVILDWVAGKIVAKEQDHSHATYTKKIGKEDAELSFSVDKLCDTTKIPTQKSYEMFRKIQAYHQWPQAYFFIAHEGKKMRVKITDASFANNELDIKKVIPEGKKEISFSDFLRSYLK